jgi:hypothetical protein
MAAVHGSSGSILFDEYDLSAYFTQASLSKQVQVVDTTTFGSAGNKAYIAGPGEGTVSFNGIWDGDASAADEVLAASLGVDTIITVAVGGASTFGNPALMLQALEAGYQIRSTVTDAVRITANATGNGGVRVAGVLLQPLEAETTTFDGTSVDNTASSAFGGAAHLHVTAFTGTSGVCKVQSSTNDTDWSDLITFTTVSGVTSERTSVTGTVPRYLRFAITTDSFTSMTVACAFARNRRA